MQTASNILIHGLILAKKTSPAENSPAASAHICSDVFALQTHKTLSRRFEHSVRNVLSNESTVLVTFCIYRCIHLAGTTVLFYFAI